MGKIVNLVGFRLTMETVHTCEGTARLCSWVKRLALCECWCYCPRGWAPSLKKTQKSVLRLGLLCFVVQIARGDDTASPLPSSRVLWILFAQHLRHSCVSALSWLNCVLRKGIHHPWPLKSFYTLLWEDPLRVVDTLSCFSRDTDQLEITEFIVLTNNTWRWKKRRWKEEKNLKVRREGSEELKGREGQELGRVDLFKYTVWNSQRINFRIVRKTKSKMKSTWTLLAVLAAVWTVVSSPWHRDFHNIICLLEWYAWINLFICNLLWSGIL